MQTLQISFEGVDSYPLWRRIARALGGRGGAVQPLEFARGRILAAVVTDEGSGALVERLAKALGEGFEVTPIGMDAGMLRVAVVRRAVPEELGAPPPASDPTAPAPPHEPAAR